MKIVLNGCYGGFGLSYEAMVLYWHARCRDLYFYRDISVYDDYSKVHKYERISLSDIQQSRNTWTGFIYCTTKDQGEYLDHFPENVVHDRDIERTDPILVSVVETMGSKAASGRFASLEIQEIPDNTLYKIDEYDGLESLITQDDDDWLIARDHDIDQSDKQHIENLWATIKPAPNNYDPDLMFRYDK